MTIARHTVYVRGRYCGRIVNVPSGVTRVRVTVTTLNTFLDEGIIREDLRSYTLKTLKCLEIKIGSKEEI
jgi:hypothetical protein